MAAMGAPVGSTGCRPFQLPGIDRPCRQFRQVVDGDLCLHGLLDEGNDIAGGNPRRAEAGGDVGGHEIGGLDALQRRNIALKGGVEVSGRAGKSELRADCSGQIGIGHLPGTIRGIAEDRLPQFTDYVVDVPV